MDEVKQLAFKSALQDATERAGVRANVAQGARALIAQDIGDRLEVESAGGGNYRVDVVTESGRTSLQEFVKAWTGTPAAAPFMGSGRAPSSENPHLADPSSHTRDFVIPRRPDGLGDKGMAVVSTLSDELEDTLGALRERMGEIQVDFRPGAQAREISRAAAAAAERITALGEAQLRPVAASVERAEAELFAPAFRHRIPAGVDPEDWRFAEVEARAHLREMDPIERQALYLEAARSGDRQTVRAFELAPAVAPLVTKEEIAEAAALFAEAVAPERYRALEEARYLRDSIEGSMALATEGFRRMTGLMANDPIAAQAGGA